MWKLGSGVTRLTGVIESLERAELFRRFRPQNRQNADKINTGDNLSMESDSQAHQHQSFACNNDIEAKNSFIGRDDSSLFICVLSDQVIAFWTSPHVAGVACEGKYFFTSGRWRTSPLRGPLLPCEQALTIQKNNKRA